MKKIRLIPFFPLLVISLLVAACSDNSSGVPDEDPPEVPETSPVEVDLSYFNEADAGTDEEYQAFNTASIYAQTGSAFLFNGLGFGSVYLNMSEGYEPDFDDGWWVWTYSYQDENGSITIKTTARETSSAYEWKVYLSGTFDGEEDLEEFLFIDGYTSLDGNSGEWNYYIPDQGSSPSLHYEWNITSETAYESNSTIRSDDGEEFNVDYQVDGAENWLEMSSPETEGDIVYLYWNTESGTGYFEQNGERQCWDQNYQQTSCS
ncbi:MAG: hypothetical protein WEA56_00395 [Balneolaceae bacterium]